LASFSRGGRGKGETSSHLDRRTKEEAFQSLSQGKIKEKIRQRKKKKVVRKIPVSGELVLRSKGKG